MHAKRHEYNTKSNQAHTLSLPENIAYFCTLLGKAEALSVSPLFLFYPPLRHPGLDPGSLRTSDDAATQDCGSEPAMTFFFYRCGATCAVIPQTLAVIPVADRGPQ